MQMSEQVHLSDLSRVHLVSATPRFQASETSLRSIEMTMAMSIAVLSVAFELPAVPGFKVSGSFSSYFREHLLQTVRVMVLVGRASSGQPSLFDRLEDEW